MVGSVDGWPLLVRLNMSALCPPEERGEDFLQSGDEVVRFAGALG
jgi:hypothetical protein